MAVFYRHFSSHTRYQVNQPRVLINTKIKLKGKEGPSYCYAGPNSGGDLPYLLSHKASCYDFLLLKKHRLVCDLSKVITAPINTLLASSDGRCVQAPGEYSGCHNETI